MEKMSSSKFISKPLTINDKEEVEKLLFGYVKDEPICRFLNFSEEEKQRVVKGYLAAALNGVSIGLYNQETKELASIAVITLPGYHVSGRHFAGPDGRLSKKLQTLVDFDEYGESGSSEFFGSDNIINLELGYVKPKYRGCGTHNVVVDWAEKVGRVLDCDGLFVVTNLSPVGWQFVRRGFVEVKKVFYKDYCDPITGEAVFANMSHDKEHALLLVKRLKPLSSKL